MAVFQPFPRLYDQSGQGTTTNYYGGLNKSPTLSSYAGNQNAGSLKTGTATSPSPNTTPTPSPTQTGRQITVDPATGHLLIDGRPIGEGNSQFGSAGQLYDGPGQLESYDPRYYEQYQRYNGDSGTETAWRIRPDVLARLGDRVQLRGPGVVGRNPDGSVMEGQGYQEVLDPTQVSWDDEFGLVTNRNNISGPDPQKERQDRLRNAVLMMALTAGTVGAIGQAGGFTSAASGGAGVIPGLDVASGTVGAPGYLAEGGGALAGGGASIPTAMTEGYLAGGAAAPTITGGGAAAASAAGLAGGTMPTIAAPAMEMPALTGAANPALSAAPNLSGGFPWSTAGRAALNIGGGLANWYLGNRTQSGMNAAADRADPYGPYRERGATNLHALEANPDSVTQTPQYQFLQQQGEQGIQRTAAKTGYFRSPNMLFDLSKFNQGLAAQEYNKEWERRAAEAGVNINPSTGAQIQANGVTGSNNMRAAAGSQLITQIVNSTPDFYNWLFGA